MDAVLHVEPIMRHVKTPLSVGHTDYITYGESFTEDNENIGTSASMLQLGCPLQTIDHGSTRSHIPLVKTIEYRPDFTRKQGNIYTETLHYLKDRQHLIPFRSKIRSGVGHNTRITHLPSLNAIRENLTGCSQRVCDPRTEIVTELLLRDQYFNEWQNKPLKDWITEELSMRLSTTTTNILSFDTVDLTRMIHQYSEQIRRTSSELTIQNLRDVSTIIIPEIGIIPPSYKTDQAIQYHLGDVRSRIIPSEFNFKSFGHIPVHQLENIDYNPYCFQSICEVIDRIPLTDFNVDIVVAPDCTIEFYHEHIALDRFGEFADNDFGLYSAECILTENLQGLFLNQVLQKFVDFHSCMTERIAEQIYSKPMKLKIIKTITDEAAILLYPYNSNGNDPPLCGVYFDIALQSLAPLSIIREPIIN